MNDRFRKLCTCHPEFLGMNDALLLDPIEYDKAIIGRAKNEKGQWVAVYHYSKLVEVTQALFSSNPSPPDPDEADDQAVEWVDYNVVRGCQYEQARRGPLVVTDMPEDEPVSDEETLKIGDVVYARCF